VSPALLSGRGAQDLALDVYQRTIETFFLRFFSLLDQASDALCRLKLKTFQKFDSAATALEEVAAIIEGKVTPRLASLLDSVKDEKKVSLVVADPKLGTLTPPASVDVICTGLLTFLVKAMPSASSLGSTSSSSPIPPPRTSTAPSEPTSQR